MLRLFPAQVTEPAHVLGVDGRLVLILRIHPHNDRIVWFYLAECHFEGTFDRLRPVQTAAGAAARRPVAGGRRWVYDLYALQTHREG